MPGLTHGNGSIDSFTWLSILRLGIFLVLIVRFYLGAVTVFVSPIDRKPNDAVDLLVGLLHFLFFFGWATTIDVPVTSRWRGETSPFLFLMVIVLLFDIFWWLLSWGRRFEKLNLWTVVNTATAALCVLIHLAAVVTKVDLTAAEEFTFLPVAVVSIVDVSEITSGKEIFRRFFHTL